jgi:hypothetical protein
MQRNVDFITGMTSRNVTVSSWLLMPALLAHVLTATSNCGNKATTNTFCQIWTIRYFSERSELGDRLRWTVLVDLIQMIFVLGIKSIKKEERCKEYGAADDVILACEIHCHCNVHCCGTQNPEARGTVCARPLVVHKVPKYKFQLKEN